MKENLSELQLLLKKKLEGGKFRLLNEQLYTMSGEEAEKLFKEDPSLFEMVRVNHAPKMLTHLVSPWISSICKRMAT